MDMYAGPQSSMHESIRAGVCPGFTHEFSKESEDQPWVTWCWLAGSEKSMNLGSCEDPVKKERMTSKAADASK